MSAHPHRAAGRPRPPRRIAMAVLYIVIVLVVLFAFASLAVDYGKVQLAKTELGRAADAAARASTSALGHITNVQNTAAAYAAPRPLNAGTLCRACMPRIRTIGH